MSPLVSALAAAAALRGSVDVSARTEVRARSSIAGVVGDLETSVDAAAAVRSRRWELKLGYAPRLTLRGDVGASPDFLHTFSIGAAYTGRRASFSFYEEGSYGRLRWTPLFAGSLLGLGPIRPDALPALQVIDYASSRTGLRASLAPARRWSLGLSLEYALSGGVDAASRASIPFQTGPRGALTVERALTRADRLTSTLGASWTSFSSGQEALLVEAAESWRRALSRNTESTLTAGVAWANARAGASEAFSSQAYPVAEATIFHSISSLRLEARASGRLSPVIDPVLGRVDQRLESAGLVSWSATGALSIAGQVGVAQSVAWARPGAVTLVYHGLTMTYRVSRNVKLDGGTRGSWWGTRGEDGLPPQWIVFAGVTLTAPRMRF